MPGAVELVYDNYNFLAIGYCSTERASHCIVSLAAAANGVIGAAGVGVDLQQVADDFGEAVAWFEDVLGGINPLTFGPFSDPTGTFMHDLLEVDPRASRTSRRVPSWRSRRRTTWSPVSRRSSASPWPPSSTWSTPDGCRSAIPTFPRCCASAARGSRYPSAR